jgi:acyl dehydratase
MKKTLALSAVAGYIGQEVAVSDWIAVTQEQVNQFAQATGDHQWIHVDVERAKGGPFGGTIAHGFFTLSLLPQFIESSLAFEPMRMGVNYGLNKVRFISPVRVGSRVRGRMKLLSCEPIADQGVQMAWEVTVECEGMSKPACVAESLARIYP